jgi:hypothetical protein
MKEKFFVVSGDKSEFSFGIVILDAPNILHGDSSSIRSILASRLCRAPHFPAFWLFPFDRAA